MTKSIKIFIVMLGFLITGLSISMVIPSCTNGVNNNAQVIVKESEPAIGENLNLQAVGEIIKSSNSPEEIEQKLNDKSCTINNLDLDGDGVPDYLKVTEYENNGMRGYSITDAQSDGEPEVVNITVNMQNSTMNINGNQQYYGNNNFYQSSFTSTDFLLMAYLMRPYRPYYSPYHYGHYPGYYAPRRVNQLL